MVSHNCHVRFPFEVLLALTLPSWLGQASTVLDSLKISDQIFYFALCHATSELDIRVHSKYDVVVSEVLTFPISEEEMDSVAFLDQCSSDA